VQTGGADRLLFLQYATLLRNKKKGFLCDRYVDVGMQQGSVCASMDISFREMNSPSTFFAAQLIPILKIQHKTLFTCGISSFKENIRLKKMGAQSLFLSHTSSYVDTTIVTLETQLRNEAKLVFSCDVRR
jgi:hypothetical protein